MSIGVSQLAVMAKTDQAQYETLWNAAYKLIAWWANKYHTDQGSRLYEADDLIQSGFIALHNAVQSYNPEWGEFTTHLRYHVRTQFAKVIGTYGKKRPETYAISLDEVISIDGETARVDMLADPDAEFANSVVDDEATRQDFVAIYEEIQNLSDVQKRALMLTAYDGLTYTAAGEIMGITKTGVQEASNRATRALKRTKVGVTIGKSRGYRKIRHVTLAEYFRTGISAVEWAIMK